MEWNVQAEAKRSYRFKYDNLSQLTDAAYNGVINVGMYNTSYQYDKHGNIRNLVRRGKNTSAADNNVVIDKLTMTYSGNQLVNVADTVANFAYAPSADFKDKVSPAGTIEYTYNANGAMAKDLNKGISNIAYNSLNLPRQMVINSATAKAKNYYTYSASGVKLKTEQRYDPNLSVMPLETTNPTNDGLADYKNTDYVGNIIYETEKKGSSITNKTRILVDGGYLEGGVYYFYLSDHLGNNRVVANATGTPIQKNHYYPFGTAFAEGTPQEQGKQPYKYNGKQLDDMHQLNLYDYSARYYESALGRFTSVDPLAEKYYGWSPYVYCLNDPIKHTDPDGKAPWLGALIGAAIDYGVQVGVNYAQGKSGTEAWTDVDVASIAISAAAGATGVGLANVVSKSVTAVKAIQNGSKVVKVAAVVAVDGVVGATVSTGSQLAKTHEVDPKAVVVDAVASIAGGAIGRQVKAVKQSNQQGKQLAKEANRDARVAGMKGGVAPTTARPNRVAKANTSARKAENYGNKSATVASETLSNTASKIYDLYDDKKKQ